MLMICTESCNVVSMTTHGVIGMCNVMIPMHCLLHTFSIMYTLFTHKHTQHGKARFVVLLSDMLLVLKARKQGKSPHMEWFADQEYSMKTVSDERYLHIHLRWCSVELVNQVRTIEVKSVVSCFFLTAAVATLSHCAETGKESK